MRARLIIALLTASMAAHAACADVFSNPTSFRGFRVEGDIGGDRFGALSSHKSKLGYGVTVGFDGVIADKILVGAEGSYWRASKWEERCVPGVYTGSFCTKSFQEFGTAARIGYLVTPKLAVFGKGGWVSNEQRTRFDPVPTLLYINGQIVPPQQPFYRHGSENGYQLGGGAEYNLTDMFYVGAQYVYARYDNHTNRKRAFLSVGVRF